MTNAKIAALVFLAMVAPAWWIIFSLQDDVGFLKPILAVLISGLLFSCAFHLKKAAGKQETVKLLIRGLLFSVVVFAVCGFFVVGRGF